MIFKEECMTVSPKVLILSQHQKISSFNGEISWCIKTLQDNIKKELSKLNMIKEQIRTH